ncbi:helix-turn-helix domain-containing protein [Rhizobium oryzicola]|uniref:Helix-turn-helix transcriptional regulator n=1 Tax=Rhizobium oryzicola TaxID=1232668 RepID=A0ABT8T1Q0_9HYPH|nr:helix-turn-helix transcriptional regulator [Rhizobium oryzicola]MDO1584592.1 helix-turn-helix transcriptional regulator [Rhizobium oryzicola]
MPPRTSTFAPKDDQAALRREVGAWLKDRREAAGLSQRDLAMKVGIDYYTFISQIETGRGRVPPERYELYANALKIPVRDFVMTILRYNEPIIYGLLFDGSEDEQIAPQASALDAKDELMLRLERRLAMLESKLGQ